MYHVKKIELALEDLNVALAKWVATLPSPLKAPDWQQGIAFRYRKKPRLELQVLTHLIPLRLDDLKNIESQKSRVYKNTLQFVRGLPANNVLMTGARGTGKSSLVRACLHALAHEGLRLIELDKDDLLDLADIVALLAERPEKFIIFCDDLSFGDNENSFKVLKSVLDGSIASTLTPNVVIYATSNRRHLLPEYLHENQVNATDGEIHPAEIVEEKISLSDRFGLWVSFYPFNQSEYLAVVESWLRYFQYGVHGQDE
ncbi:MAG: ATP-binding protein, partial [Gammaproteobacteria bacterium]|nr:ATP-binding protein [Gammaproteobacteria bacterium]